MAISLGGFSGGGGGASTDTLDDVTGRGATTTNAVTVGGLSIGTAYTMPTSDGSANQVLSTDGSGSILFSTLNITGGLEYKGAFNATAGTPSIANAEKGDFYIIDTAGTIYGQTWGVGDHLLINENMGGSVTNSKIDKIDNTDAVSSVNGQTGPVSLGVGNLSDVTITGAANGEVLKYDGSAWVDATLAYSEISGTPTNISTFTNDSNYLTAITGQSIGSLSDVTITGAANGEYLRYNGSAWVDAALGIADDTSPSLGGNLDVSGNDIISASNGAIEIAPDGTGSVIIKGNTAASATNTGHIKLNCENNSHHVKIAAPAHAAISAGGSYTLTLPADDGDANEVLQTDGSGNLSWVAQSGGSGGGFTYSAISSTTPAQAQYHYSCTGTFTLTLPAASGITAGEEIRVKNMGTGTITIDRSSTDTIDAQASITLGVQYQMLSFVSNGSNGYEVI